MPQIIEYPDEKTWLDLRRKAVTSTEIAALLGESPYCTEFELWHRKKNDVELEFIETDRTKWGKRFEAPVAEGLAEDYGWHIKPLKVFMLHSTVSGMGSSFDYEIIKDGRKGILEIKTVDYKEYKSKWIDDSETIEAPVHIELQLQHQLEVSDYDFGIIACMIGGNKPVVTERERDREIGKLMCGKVSSFWRSIKDNQQPLPDFQRDAEIIRKLYADASGSEVDLSSNNRFAVLLSTYPELQKAESDAKKAKDAAKAEMTMIMGNAPLAKCGDAWVSSKIVKRGAYSVAETSYRDFRIKQASKKSSKQKGEAA